MAAQNNLIVEEISQRDFVLRSNDRIVGLLTLDPNWIVMRGTTSMTLQRVFAIRERPEIEIVRQVVRRPTEYMPVGGVFDRNGGLVGPAGPPPYPNHTAPEDFKRD